MKLRFLSMLIAVFFVQIAFAQESEVNGIVQDENGLPLPGIAVEVEGTSTGTNTDFEGNFTIEAEQGDVLVFSSMGLQTVEQEVEDVDAEIEVTMQEASEELEEAVVTAYGIKKERKALTYKTEGVSGDKIIEARETNVTDALAGKVSGLNLTKSTNGPAGSSKIILRGFNSLTGDNQPLIVVDGVPMTNFVGSDNNDFWNQDLDMGNGLSDLNPEDIEDINVLKGGAASALYGSRAGDGVIEITTKQGKENDGAGITYSTTLNTQTMMGYPNQQEVFSQGADGDYVKDSEESWGEKIEGQTVELTNGSEETLRPYDNVKSFFDNGYVQDHTLTFQQNVGGNTGVFTSLSYQGNDGMVPNTNYNRINATTRVNSKWGEEERWSTDVKVQYINSKAKNRPIGGHDRSYFKNIMELPTTVNLENYKETVKENLGIDATEDWYIPNDDSNPYWQVYNRQNRDKRDRFMLNASLGYEFTDWLDVNLKVGTDLYNTRFERKVYTGGQPVMNMRSAKTVQWRLTI